MKFKLILFDVAGVLYHNNLAVGEYIEEKLGIPQDKQDFWSDSYPRLTKGEITTDEFIDDFCLRYGIDRASVSAETFVKPFRESLKPTDGMGELIKELKLSDLTLSILSDTVEMFDIVRKDIKLYDSFDKVFISYEVGSRKPETEMYKAALDYYQIAPEKVVFIDDRETNVEAAKKLGIHGIVFSNTEQLKTELIRAKII